MKFKKYYYGEYHYTVKKHISSGIETHFIDIATKKDDYGGLTFVKENDVKLVPPYDELITFDFNSFLSNGMPLFNTIRCCVSKIICDSLDIKVTKAYGEGDFLQLKG